MIPGRIYVYNIAKLFFNDIDIPEIPDGDHEAWKHYH